MTFDILAIIVPLLPISFALILKGIDYYQEREEKEEIEKRRLSVEKIISSSFSDETYDKILEETQNHSNSLESQAS